MGHLVTPIQSSLNDIMHLLYYTDMRVSLKFLRDTLSTKMF